MTTSAHIDRVPLAARPRSELARELIETIRLAAPMALTQLGQIAMMTTDLAMIGRLGEAAVAGAALAGTVYFISFTTGLGVVSAVAPLAAQAFGARDPHRIRRATRAGLWAALLVSLPMMAFPLFGERILLALGQAPGAAQLAQQNLLGLFWGATPALWLIALRGFMSALNRPQPVLWITLAAIPLNAALVYLLIHGGFGLPALGLFGAGLGTTIVNVVTFIAGAWIALRRRPFAKYHVFGHVWRLDWPLLGQLFAIGTPISLAFLMEYGLFSSAALLAGLISTAAVAAHQIALQVAAILFMVPLGIAMAATVRVGQAIGRGDPAGARRAGNVALGLGLVIAAVLTAATVIDRRFVISLFLGRQTEGVETTTELAATLMLIGTSFFMTDAVQTIAAGALRGMKDTRIPLMFALIGYWLIGFTSAWLLAFHAGLGAVGIWIGLSLGTLVYAALLTWRFQLLAHRAVNA